MDLRMACVVAAVGLAVGCGGGGTSTTTTSQPAAPPAKEAAPPAKTDAGAPVATGDFGVPECDAYFRKYLACLDSPKVPEATRAQAKAALDQSKAAWKMAAATPQGKATLATTCTQALDMSKKSMSAFGCQW
jgi:hypothetical protein